MKQSKLFALIMLCCPLVFAGCVAVDPMIRSPALFEARYASDGAPAPDASSETWLGGIASTLDAVDAQRRAYLEAARQLAILSNAGPLVAAGLGVSSLLVAALGGPSSRDTAIGLGAGAASALGLTTFYDREIRQAIYLGAADALGCLIVAYAPLRIRRSVFELLARDAASLRDTLDRLVAATGTRQRWTNEQIGELRQRANEAIWAVETLPQTLATAEIRLRERAIALVTAVDRELTRTAPDPAAVFATVGGITTGIETLIPSAFQRPDARQMSRGEDAEADRLADRAQAQLAGLTARLRSVASVDQAHEAAASCRLPDLPGLLRVTPPDTVRTIATVPAELTYVVSGGQGGQSIFLRSGVPGFELRSEPPVGGSTRVTVRVTEAAKGRTESLVVADGSGRASREIVLRVAADAATTTSQAASRSGSGARGEARQSTADLTPQEEALVRLRLELDRNTPLTGETARAALKDFAAALGRSDTSPRDIYELVIGEARRAALARPPNEFETSLLEQGGNGGHLHRCLLGLPVALSSAPSAVFDRSFRGAMFDFQRKSPPFQPNPTQQVHLPITGELDEDQRRNLERNAPAAMLRRCGGIS